MTLYVITYVVTTNHITLIVAATAHHSHYFLTTRPNAFRNGRKITERAPLCPSSACRAVPIATPVTRSAAQHSAAQPSPLTQPLPAPTAARDVTKPSRTPPKPCANPPGPQGEPRPPSARRPGRVKKRTFCTSPARRGAGPRGRSRRASPIGAAARRTSRRAPPAGPAMAGPTGEGPAVARARRPMVDEAGGGGGRAAPRGGAVANGARAGGRGRAGSGSVWKE